MHICIATSLIYVKDKLYTSAINPKHVRSYTSFLLRKHSDIINIIHANMYDYLHQL